MRGNAQYLRLVPKLVALAAVCAVGLSTTAPAQAQQTNLTAVTTVTLNMRTGPSTAYGVILAIPANSSVAVYQCTTSQSWCEVGYAGRIGWSSARYLNFGGGYYNPTPQPQPQPAPPPVAGQVQARTTVSLNMRYGPSTSYSVIRAIPAGATVGVNRCTQSYSWCEVTYAGSTGWSAARYLTATTPQYNQQPIANVGALLGLRLFEFILGQIAGGGQQQPPPDQDPPGLAPDEICFYRDFNYQGPSACIRMGRSEARLGPNWNDAISSIRLGRNARVEVCEHFDYQGLCRIANNDVPRIGDSLNDRISSVRTISIGGGGGGNPPPQQARVCFYADWNYQGQSFCVERGTDIQFLGPEWNDRISSFRVGQGLTVEICEHANYAGRCERYTSGVQQLTGPRNDAISSIRVR